MLGVTLLFLSGTGVANEADDVAALPEVAEPDLEVVLVTGGQPGPGLWQVVSPSGHVLWILGEVSPFTRQVKWQTKKFDRLLRNSQELLLDYSGYWRAGEKEMTAYRREDKLPAGTALKDLISADLHSRVETTAKFFGTPALQELRPFSATNRLVTSAMKTMDLTGFSARFSAEALGRKRRVKVTYFAAPEPPFEERLRLWQHASNTVCLERLVDAIEDGGDGVKRLSNAWSIGDIDALRELVPAFSFSRDGFRADDCAAAMRGGEQKSRDYDAARMKGWLAQAERALRDNKSTMAVVLMSELFATDGYLAALRERGYEVVEPE